MGDLPKKPVADQAQGAAEAYRKAEPYLGASWSLVSSVALWTAVGYWLDGKFGTRPWLLVAGSVIGVGLGFYLFFKTLLQLGRRGSGGK